MITSLRSLFNRVDRAFDRKAITEESHLTREAGGDHQRMTAQQALEFVLPAAREFDRGARLKSIVSQQGVDREGTSAHWEFFFDLPDRRAKLAAEWVLGWDEAADQYATARVEITVRPSPPAGSPLRQAVRQGSLLHRQLEGLWKQERARLPDLPLTFHDSRPVIEELIQQGLDLALGEFSLSTGRAPDGRLSWVAQARHQTYYAKFT